MYQMADTPIPATLDAVIKELKALRKDIRKVRQHLEDPDGKKAEARAANNGFNKPQKISEKLRAFLSLGPEDMISRAQVTTRINQYITEKGLKAGQQISLDESMKDLLVVPEGTQVTFLNIQKYINPHYVKEPKPEGEKKPRAKKAVETPAADAPVAEGTKEKKSRPKVAKAPTAA
jgi:chromatin remodeling complex protein RSC6